MSSSRRVLVLNHFAITRAAQGGTRHQELFERLTGWDTTIVGADRLLLGRDRFVVRSDGFRTVPTTPYGRSAVSRILNWVSYAISAVVYGLISRRPDVVYASSPHLLAGLAGWLIARARRARFVLEIRDLWPQILVDMGQIRQGGLIHRALRALEHFLYGHADHIVVVARGSAGAVRAHGVPDQNVTFIPNGAEPADFASPAPRSRLRAGLGVSGLVVLYAGAHGLANGLNLLLDAAGEVRDELPEVRFVLVGDGQEKARLIERARVEGLSNVVFRDAVPKVAMPAILGAADVGLHVLADVPLFRYGVSPNKLFDYMAAGLPVITNCPGEVGDIVAEAGAGIVVEPSRIADGVRALVATDHGRRKAMGAAGVDFIERTHSRTVLARRLQHVLDSTVERPQRAAEGTLAPIPDHRGNLPDGKQETAPAAGALPWWAEHVAPEGTAWDWREGALVHSDADGRAGAPLEEASSWRRRFVGLVYADQNSSPAVRRALGAVLDVLHDGYGVNLGSGATNLHDRLVNVDVVWHPAVDVVTSGSLLPFKSASARVVIAQEVLEHIADVRTTVDEVHRILEPGGAFYCQVPFQIGHHPGPADYWRFSHQGLEALFADGRWDVADIEIALGYASGFYRIAVEFLAVTASLLHERLYLPAKAAAALLLYPVKLLDRFTSRTSQRHRIAAGYYAIVRKR